MIEWEKMSNFAVSFRQKAKGKRQKTRVGGHEAGPFHLRFKSVSSPFQVRSVYWRDISTMIGIRASLK